jgi:hypothetical protein
LIMPRSCWLQRSSFRPTTNRAGSTSIANKPCIIQLLIFFRQRLAASLA